MRRVGHSPSGRTLSDKPKVADPTHAAVPPPLPQVRAAAREIADVTGVQMVAAVSVILTVHCARAASGPTRRSDQEPSPFRVDREPELGIRDYLMQIRKGVRCSKECFVLALIYIDRLVGRCPQTDISNLTVHRLLIASILAASKFLDDKGCDNPDYAKVGGLTIGELNTLEMEFAKRLDWKFHVKQHEYEWYRELACMAAAGR